MDSRGGGACIGTEKDDDEPGGETIDERGGRALVNGLRARGVGGDLDESCAAEDEVEGRASVVGAGSDDPAEAAGGGEDVVVAAARSRKDWPGAGLALGEARKELEARKDWPDPLVSSGQGAERR